MNAQSLFLRRLGVVLGVGSIGCAACGGKVIFDTSSGAGSGASSGAGAATSTGSGGAPGTSASFAASVNTTGAVTGGSTGAGCMVAVPKAPDQIENVCVNKPTGACPPITDPGLPTSLTTVIDAGVSCPQNRMVVSVACANPSAVECCYTVVTAPNCQLGRPFLIGEAARTARGAERPDWRADTAPDIASLDTATRADLAARWTRDALAEHASIAAFARVALELLGVGAPALLVRDAGAAMRDEVRHAALSFALASAYAGSAIGPGRLAVEGAAAASTLAEIAAATVRDGCVNETVSALLAAEARDGATDAAARAALEEIAADEARHGELAWRTVDWMLSVGGRDVHAAVASAFAEATGNVAASEHGSSTLRAHGQLGAQEKAAVSRDAVAEVIRPAAQALLSKHAARLGQGVDEAASLREIAGRQSESV